MKRIATLLTVLTLVMLPSLQAEVDTIYVKNYEYDDDTTDIDQGDTIVFKWVEGDHPTASDNGDWTTFPMDAGNTEKMLVLTDPGTYPFYCTNHGGAGGQGMSGVIIVEDESTGIDEPTTDVKASIYPNPAVSQVTVEFPEDSYTQVKVFNILGSQAMSREIKRGMSKIQLDLNDLKSGNYLVAFLRDGEIMESLRMMKR